MSKLKIYTYLTLFLAIGLGIFLVSRIKFSIDEESRITRAENLIIDNLKIIRDAQVTFQSVKGSYTSDWDSLINFVENGEIFIVQRREETVLLDYGAEETTLYLDTLGSISVIDSVFSEYKSFSPNSMKFVPGYENVVFEMWAGQIEKGGVSVNVVEVRNPKPVDPDRKESNEANINKPLRFGSRTSITTAGNWE